VENLEVLAEVLEEHRGEFDALGVSTRIQMPLNFFKDYYRMPEAHLNPWGGVEAIFTHALCTLYGFPAAHSPMFDSLEISNIDFGVVDPRVAAENISTAFFVSVLKGLQRSPRIVRNVEAEQAGDLITAANISCLVIPDGCVGLPTLAALEQGIAVIAVRENKNVMQNDLSALPWAPGQLRIVENYWEAAGVMAALRLGLDPLSLRRPLAATLTQKRRTR
jgi:hypothetical protein